MTEKAEVLRGWKSPASRYSRLKAEIEGMQRNIERRKAELQALPVTIEGFERDVAQLKIAFAQEQAKVDQEAADELIEQFLSHARDLDAAFTTEKLAMWKKGGAAIADSTISAGRCELRSDGVVDLSLDADRYEVARLSSAASQEFRGFKPIMVATGIRNQGSVTACAYCRHPQGNIESASPNQRTVTAADEETSSTPNRRNFSAWTLRPIRTRESR